VIVESRPEGGADLAFNLVNSVRHLRGDSQVTTHLEQMARILRPGGIYVVGISLASSSGETKGAAADDARFEEDVWRGTRGGCRVTQIVNYLPPHFHSPRRERCSRWETVVSHLVIERSGGVEHRDHRYELRTYTQEQWRRLVDRSSLRHVASVDAGGRPLEDRIPPYQLEILRRH
jgi:hypothetical protein